MPVSDMNETLIQVMKNSYVDERMLEEMFNLEHIGLSSEDPPEEEFFQAVVNENGHKVNMTEAEYGLSETIKWRGLEEKAKFDSPGNLSLKDIKTLITRQREECYFELIDYRFSKPARRTWEDWTSSWNGLFGDPPVKRSLEIVENKNGHKFNMTEGEYNLWKDMPEELKDKLIQMCPEKAEVVERLRSEARKRSFFTSLDFLDTVSMVNLWTSLAFISAPVLLDREYYRDRNSVSYKMFTAFMICIIFSFTGAFCALLIRNKPKLAVLRRCYFWLSIVSMASALSILGFALFWKV